MDHKTTCRMEVALGISAIQAAVKMKLKQTHSNKANALANLSEKAHLMFSLLLLIVFIAVLYVLSFYRNN